MKINFRRSMDLFAIALITITIGTLAIIGLFILICAFQPLVLRLVKFLVDSNFDISSSFSVLFIENVQQHRSSPLCTDIMNIKAI